MSHDSWQRSAGDTRLQFPMRSAFEAVVGIEFAPQMAAQILAEHAGVGVDYAVNLWHGTTPTVGDAPAVGAPA